MVSRRLVDARSLGVASNDLHERFPPSGNHQRICWHSPPGQMVPAKTLRIEAAVHPRATTGSGIYTRHPVNDDCRYTKSTVLVEEHEFIRLHISKYTMVVIVVNEQCNTGDPLETSGGLYRGPPSMLIYINTIKCCAYVKVQPLPQR